MVTKPRFATIFLKIKVVNGNCRVKEIQARPEQIKSLPGAALI
jgi:hypothetical protein